MVSIAAAAAAQEVIEVDESDSFSETGSFTLVDAELPDSNPTPHSHNLLASAIPEGSGMPAQTSAAGAAMQLPRPVLRRSGAVMPHALLWAAAGLATIVALTGGYRIFVVNENQKQANLQNANEALKQAAVDEEAAKAESIASLKRSADEEAHLKNALAVSRQEAQRRNEKAAAKAAVAVAQQRAVVEAKLKATNKLLRKETGQEDTTKIILLLSLVLMIGIVVALYVCLVRAKTQNAHNLSMVVKMSSDRLKCMDRIKELTKPILEESCQIDNFLDYPILGELTKHILPSCESSGGYSSEHFTGQSV